ncbi:MAG: cell division protein FtsH, partial [Solirubrobacteraceae bacterium]|nr:cell division protein FtsH [Solirubrobacteraceae bacterium]
SDEIAREIDDEIRRIVEIAHTNATRTLEEHREKLDRIAEILMRRETIERDEFLALIEGRSELDVFGPEDEVKPDSADAQADTTTSGVSVTKPNPGLAGGSAS